MMKYSQRRDKAEQLQPPFCQSVSRLGQECGQVGAFVCVGCGIRLCDEHGYSGLYHDGGEIRYCDDCFGLE